MIQAVKVVMNVMFVMVVVNLPGLIMQILMVMALAIIVVQLPRRVALLPPRRQIPYIMIIQMLMIPVTVE